MFLTLYVGSTFMNILIVARFRTLFMMHGNPGPNCLAGKKKIKDDLGLAVGGQESQ
jgi:hypothetical protein